MSETSTWIMKEKNMEMGSATEENRDNYLDEADLADDSSTWCLS